MHRRSLSIAYTIVLLTLSPIASAQLSPIASAQEEPEHGHSDIQFTSVNGALFVPAGPEGYVFEGEFPLEGIDRQFATEPGFSSEVADGLGINPHDQVHYNVLGSLMYWNDGFHGVPDPIHLVIVNQPPAPVVPDTIVSATSGPQLAGLDPTRNRIGEANELGDFHSDLQFILRPNLAPFPTPESVYGAYGVMLNLVSDEPGIDASNPFFVVFNLGLEDEVFETGVAAYANLVPEPPGLNLSLYGLSGLFVWVRYRRTVKGFGMVASRPGRWLNVPGPSA